jgi:hypothetical protein
VLCSLVGVLRPDAVRPPLGPPQGPRHIPTEGYWGGAVSYERGAPVGALGPDAVRHVGEGAQDHVGPHRTPQPLHHKPETQHLHLTPYTLHPAPSTLHPLPDTRKPKSEVLNPKP